MKVEYKKRPNPFKQALDLSGTFTVRTPIVIAALIALIWISWPQTANASNCPESLSFKFLRLQDEAPQDLCQFQGKVVLVVNTASYCGFTSQYEGLEKIYAEYKDKGFVVLGFPSNDFGKQEPGSNKEIADFCQNTYGVKFPMFAKSSVSGKDANPLFKYLIQKSGTTPRWNFYKYLIDRKGNVVNSYNSTTSPTSKQFISDLEKLIQDK
jgi:glutathione peroxidase